MARELQQTAPDDRRRRVQRLKKMIIGIVIVGLLIPILCCVYLICRLHAINGTLRDLEQRLEELDARDRERQTLLQQLQSETAIQQGVQTQEEVTSGEVSEHTPESDPGQEMIHKVYLTFDDGPSIYTDEILDILDRYHVKATFFVVGKHVKEHPELVKREYDEGHYIANHGYNHNNKLLYSNMEHFKEEVVNTDIEISKAIGVENYCSHIFRFPNGFMSKKYSYQKKEAVEVLNSLDYSYIDWNCLNKDSERKYSNYQLMNNLKKSAKNKGTLVVLMHDTADVNKTYDILKSSIDYLRSEGYEFKNFYDTK